MTRVRIINQNSGWYNEIGQLLRIESQNRGDYLSHVVVFENQPDVIGRKSIKFSASEVEAV